MILTAHAQCKAGQSAGRRVQVPRHFAPLYTAHAHLKS